MNKQNINYHSTAPFSFKTFQKLQAYKREQVKVKDYSMLKETLLNWYGITMLNDDGYTEDNFDTLKWILELLRNNIGEDLRDKLLLGTARIELT